jgi:hypothetical protein
MAPALPDDVSWQHFLVVNRSARMEIWQNGVLLTTDATAQTPQTSPAIGFRASGFGAFARMAIWDRAISEAEIAVLATPPSPVLPPVLNTWDDFNRADGPLGTATPSAFEWEA